MDTNIKENVRLLLTAFVAFIIVIATIVVHSFTDIPMNVYFHVQAKSIINLKVDGNLDTAIEVTKSECSPNVWRKWEFLEGEMSQAIGYADLRQVESKHSGWHRIITAHISPNLTSEEQIEHVAWHECAHVVVYSLTDSEMKELSDKLKILYPYCGMIHECFADTMAYAKTGDSSNAPYEDESTFAQLELAHEIWKSKGVVENVNYSYDQEMILDKYSM